MRSEAQRDGVLRDPFEIAEVKTTKDLDEIAAGHRGPRMLECRLR